MLETTLYAATANGLRAPLGSATASVPFKPVGEIRREELRYLVTNAQLLALEQSRTGDLRLQLQVRGVLPQASGFPGAPEATEHIGIAESRWRQQLAGLGRALGVDMLIPFPADDGPRRVVADLLRGSQRLLGGNEIDGAMLQVRKALEAITPLSAWNWPGQRKDKHDRTADERWAWIRAALEDQATRPSGQPPAQHVFGSCDREPHLSPRTAHTRPFASCCERYLSPDVMAHFAEPSGR